MVLGNYVGCELGMGFFGLMMVLVIDIRPGNISRVEYGCGVGHLFVQIR